jgi:hypothetical protein
MVLVLLASLLSVSIVAGAVTGRNIEAFDIVHDGT